MIDFFKCHVRFLFKQNFWIYIILSLFVLFFVEYIIGFKLIWWQSYVLLLVFAVPFYLPYKRIKK